MDGGARLLPGGKGGHSFGHHHPRSHRSHAALHRHVRLLLQV